MGAETARQTGLDNAAGVRALVRLSCAKSVSAAIGYALGAVDPSTGDPTDVQAVLDEIALMHGWLES